MTSIEAYKKFELKANNINTASSIDISEGEFVLIFNEQQNKWYSSKWKGRGVIYSLDTVQQLISTDQALTKTVNTTRYSEFTLPDNYLDYISSYALASKGSCKDRVVYTNQVKLNDLPSYLRDENNKPSFEYHDTLSTVSQDKLQVYKTDFSIDSVFLTYYRYPLTIDIAGYTRLDGTPSTTIDPELFDQAIDEIIDWCVLEVQRSASNPEGFQLSQNRITDNN